MLKTIFNNILPKKPYHWTIGIKVNGGIEYNLLKPPNSEFWADPFVLELNNETFIYFEIFEYKHNKGYIAVGKYDSNTNALVEIQPIIKDSYHYSFPQILKFEDKVYLIPESHKKNTIDLYEIISPPNKIKFIKTIKRNCDNADNVLFNFDSTWYLFTNPKSDELPRSHNEKLDIYYSKDLVNDEFVKIVDIQIGKTGLSNSRMAGNIFSDNNSFFRFTQDCSKMYGEKINVNEIIVLNKEQYIENFLYTMEKPKFANRMHTYNSSEKITVADFYFKRKGLIKFFAYNQYRYIYLVKAFFRKIFRL